MSVLLSQSVVKECCHGVLSMSALLSQSVVIECPDRVLSKSFVAKCCREVLPTSDAMKCRQT